MQRYYVKPEQMKENSVTFLGDEVHHMQNVMRFKPGDQVIAFDGHGRDVLVELTTCSNKRIEGRIVREIEENRELPAEISLAQGLAKGEKMDWIVQKAVELGATSVIPFISSRTIVKLDDKKESNRRARWQKIAKEAAEQSHRSRIPEITEVISFRELLRRSNEYHFSLIGYEQEMSASLHQYMDRIKKAQRILIVIGPEGGFSPQEIEEAEACGVHAFTLGKRILRTETASIAALSQLGFCLEYLLPDQT